MAGEFLRRWPTLAELRRAKPQTVRSFFYAHHSRSELLIQERLDAIATATPLTEDPALIEPMVLQVLTLCRQIAAVQHGIAEYDQRIAAVFARHPHAKLFENLPGAGPTLAPRLAALFGTAPDNWEHPDDLISFTGVGPVRRQSGKQSSVHFRWVRPKFIHQSVIEFAKCSIPKCAWARVLYDDLIARGKGRWMAIRVIAFKWLRILWRCWTDGTQYDEQRYLASLHRRGLKLYDSLIHPSLSNGQTAA
jgi:transposase